MVHLIVVLMGIGLMSYMLASGISYINPTSFESKEKFERWSALNMNLTIAWNRYHDLNGRLPADVAALQGMLSAPGPIPDNMLLTQLTTEFNGWCFEGEVSQGGFNSLKGLATRFPSQYGLSASCGTVGGVDPSWISAAANAQYPLPVVVTYRMSK